MFIEEYLQDLRRGRFSLPAIALYARRVAGRVRENVVANPGAVRSVWSVALLYFTLAFAAAVAIALLDDRALAKDFFLATALGLLPIFTLATCHLEFLRDAAGYRLSAINVPTALTLLRATLIPAILVFLGAERYGYALTAYGIAAASDVLDGWIARRWNQTTPLGTVLDPLVDIVFNFSVLAGLWMAHLLSGWVFAVACVRYGLLLVGGAGMYVLVGPLKVQPTFFGRLTGVAMTFFVGFLALLHTVDGTIGARLHTLTEVALGALLVATVGQVVALGWYNLKTMTQPESVPGRVVGDVRWGPR